MHKKYLKKFQHPSMIKTLYKLEIEENCLNIIKANIWQAHCWHHTQQWKTKSLYAKIRNRQECPFSQLLLNIVLELLAREIREEKEIKCIQIRREEVKRSQFADDMTLYVGNPEDSTKKRVRTNKWIQQRCRIQINIQKSLMFLYINDDLSEKEFKKTIHL